MMRSRKRRDFMIFDESHDSIGYGFTGSLRMNGQRFIGLMLVVVAFCAMVASGPEGRKPFITREQCDVVAASRDRIAELVDAYAAASGPGEGCRSIQELDQVLFSDITVPEKLVSYYRVRCVTLALELKSLVDFMVRSAYQAQHKQGRWIVLESRLDKHIQLLDAARRGYARALSAGGAFGGNAYGMKMEKFVDNVAEQVDNVSSVLGSVDYFVEVSRWPRARGIGRLRQVCDVNTVSYDNQLESYFFEKSVPRDYNDIIAMLSFSLLYDSLWKTYSNYCNSEDMDTVDAAPGVGWKDKSYIKFEINKAREAFVRNVDAMGRSLPMTSSYYMYPDYVRQVSCAKNVARDIMTWP